MQEKPPFSSYLDFFSNVWEGETHPLRTFNLPSGTPLPLSTFVAEYINKEHMKQAVKQSFYIFYSFSFKAFE